jgi:hypothetical protein
MSSRAAARDTAAEQDLTILSTDWPTGRADLVVGRADLVVGRADGSSGTARHFTRHIIAVMQITDKVRPFEKNSACAKVGENCNQPGTDGCSGCIALLAGATAAIMSMPG